MTSNTSTTTAVAQIAAFRAAVRAQEADVRQRLGAGLYAECAAHERRRNGGRLANELLADSVEGLDLTPDEWSTLRWFLNWDAQDTIASIITKARAHGAAS